MENRDGKSKPLSGRWWRRQLVNPEIPIFIKGDAADIFHGNVSMFRYKDLIIFFERVLSAEEVLVEDEPVLQNLENVLVAHVFQ